MISLAQVLFDICASPESLPAARADRRPEPAGGIKLTDCGRRAVNQPGDVVCGQDVNIIHGDDDGRMLSSCLSALP